MIDTLFDKVYKYQFIEKIENCLFLHKQKCNFLKNIKIQINGKLIISVI